MTSKRTVVLEGITLNETEEAVLMDIEGEEVWIPKSQLLEWPMIDDEGEVEMYEWIAIEKGLV